MKGPAGALLQLLPIVATPLEKVGIDIVAPLPRVARGHTHILVVVDYASRYLEVVALCSTIVPVIGCEPSVIFSWQAWGTCHLQLA